MKQNEFEYRHCLKHFKTIQQRREDFGSGEHCRVGFGSVGGQGAEPLPPTPEKFWKFAKNS